MPSGANSNNEPALSNNCNKNTSSSSPVIRPPPMKIFPPLASPDPDASYSCCIGINNVNNAANGSSKQQQNQDSTLDISTSSLVGPGHVSFSPIVCRICYSTCGTLYAFCKCKGSVGYVHKDCLKRWIDAKLKANRCEICQSPFSGTDWSFKPINKWASPKMGVLDKLYLALFVCCSIIVLYSIPWITYKAWRSRDVIFGDGPVTSERIFALIVIAIYVPLNISCIASLVVLWRRAVASVCQRFLDANKMWRVRVTREVADTKLINAINSTNKSPVCNNNRNDRDTQDSGAMTPIKRLNSSPRRPGVKRVSKNSLQSTEEAGLILASNEASCDSTIMLISAMGLSSSNEAEAAVNSTDGQQSSMRLIYSNNMRSSCPTEV